MTVLIEAVDAWINKDGASDLMGELFATMICGDNKEVAAKMEAERETKKFAKQIERTQRMEAATLLKAKLILMRQRLAIPTT